MELKGVLIRRLLINPLASCSLINLDLLLPPAAHFDKSIIFPFFVFTTFGFLLSVIFLYFKQDVTFFPSILEVLIN